MNQLVDVPTGDPFSREWFRLQKQDRPHSFFSLPLGYNKTFFFVILKNEPAGKQILLYYVGNQ
jgi:hypothetical protein